MTLPDFDMKSLTAIFVPFIGAVTWVGRLQQRVNRTELDVASFTAGLTKHIADDATAHERIAKIEGQNNLIIAALQRVERVLDAR